MTEEISPTLEEPVVEEPKVESEVNDAKALAERLTELGIDDLTKVEGTVKAAGEAGRLANMLGEERARAAALEQQLRDVRNQRVDIDYDDSGVDLEKVTERAMEKFWNRKQNEAQQAQQRHFQEFNSIRSDKNYKLVGKDFEEYTKTPDYQSDLMSGKTPKDVYHEMSMDVMRKNIITMRDYLLKDTVSPSDVKVPQTVTSQASPPVIEPDDEKSEKIKNIKKNWKGTSEDTRKTLDVLLDGFI